MMTSSCEEEVESLKKDKFEMESSRKRKCSEGHEEDINFGNGAPLLATSAAAAPLAAGVNLSCEFLHGV